MKRHLVILIQFLLCISVMGQSESDLLDVKNIEFKFLEHLVKTQIDSVRKKHNCEALYNDSILYIASSHHSNWMQSNNTLSHTEPSIKFKSPSDRIAHYGGHFHLTGENINKVPFNTEVKDKKGKVHKVYTYKQLAFQICLAWVYSPPHFKNMTNPDFKKTGLSIVIDTQNQIAYSCQKFGTNLYNFDFVQSKSLFPYEQKAYSERQISVKAITQQTKEQYKYNLRHSDSAKCLHCFELQSQRPIIQLYLKNGYYWVRFENSDYAKRMFRRKYDGLALEFVELEDYICGNQAYYNYPSRRNKKSALNGTLSRPIYRDELANGFKGRRLSKKIKYVSYMIGADSVPFWSRHKHYEIAKYSSSYFEHRLGKAPKEVKGYYMANLIYIQDNEICSYQTFPIYCHSLYSPYIRPKKLPHKDTIYTFNPEIKEYSFTLRFDKNDTDGDSIRIARMLNKLNNIDYTLQTAKISASASVEGDSARNLKLQKNRAQRILDILQLTQEKEIKSTITTKTAWTHFYKSVAKKKGWDNFKKLNKEEQQLLINSKSDSLENILQKERFAKVHLEYTMDITLKNTPYYLKKYYNLYLDSLNNSDSPRWQRAYLNELYKLYKYAFFLESNKLLKKEILYTLKIPKEYPKNLRFAELLYRATQKFPETYKAMGLEKRWFEGLYHTLYLYNFDNLSFEFLWTDYYHIINAFIDNPNIALVDIQTLLKEIEQLESKYNSKTLVKESLDALMFNSNIIILNRLYQEKPIEHSLAAYPALLQMKDYLKQNKLWTLESALKLARMNIYYLNVSEAENILSEFPNSPEAFLLKMSANYIHPYKPGGQQYVNQLIESSSRFSDIEWCNFFINDCTIPYQVFDNRELRELFCEKCKGKNEKINDLSK